MEDTSFNMDQLPAHLPDLPPCPVCGAAWVSLQVASHTDEDVACACVECAEGHETWFGLGIEPAGWMHLNRPANRIGPDDLDALLSQFPTSVRLSYGAAKGGPTARDPGKVAERVVAMFQFSEKGFGFGEITIMQTKEGCFIDTEHMSRETVKRFLGALVDGAVTDTDVDPEKHLLYNQEAGRRCGAHCRICYPEGES